MLTRPSTLPVRTATEAVAAYIESDEGRVRRALGMAAMAIDQATSYGMAHDPDHGPFPPLESYLLGRSIRGWVTWQLARPPGAHTNQPSETEPCDAALRATLLEAALDQVDWGLIARDILARFGHNARSGRYRAA